MWAVMLGGAAIGVATAQPDGPTNSIAALVLSVGAVSATTVGAVLITRFPRNAIGWLLGIGGFAGALQLAASGLGYLGLVTDPGSVPGAIWLFWLGNWVWTPYLVCLAFLLPLLYPTGHLPSPRWRVVAAVAIGVIVVGSVQAALSPFTGSPLPPVPNPMAPTGWAADGIAIVGVGVTLSGLVCLPLVAASLIIRYHHAAGVERAQLKWFAYVVAFIVPPLFVGLALSNETTGLLGAISNVGWALATIGLGVLPIAIGIAILRYRLYEIDRLISRSIGWAVITVMLGATFVGTILLTQALVTPVTGSSELAVAGSTLVVAALVQPIRRRVQRFVDRRFNRSQYDAEQTVAAFAARLTDEVDLEQLQAQIIKTIAETVEPTSVSIWLRD